jgi:hypothetical protein
LHPHSCRVYHSCSPTTPATFRSSLLRHPRIFLRKVLPSFPPDSFIIPSPHKPYFAMTLSQPILAATEGHARDRPSSIKSFSPFFDASSTLLTPIDVDQENFNKAFTEDVPLTRQPTTMLFTPPNEADIFQFTTSPELFSTFPGDERTTVTTGTQEQVTSNSPKRRLNPS